jgi:glyoxylase-like metal-dependent hydrolase (beta-lactamase superfamily II)
MHPEKIAGGVHRLRTLIVNLFFVRDRTSGQWALVDAGMPGHGATIRRAARQLFGRQPPCAILLTHGHFDHVGSLQPLLDEWRVPIFAHTLELPYLTGRSPYAPPDPTVGGGALAWMSPLYPRGPFHFEGAVQRLPGNGIVPGMPEWRWLMTPGHTPGHVSYFREHDRTLIAGDAVVTTREESLFNTLLERAKVWRPPAYFTSDWNAARRSVATLAALDAEVLATGHGRPLRGPAMRRGLRELADRFDRVMPSSGRYVPYPAVTDEHGVLHVPPKPGFAASGALLATAGVGAAVGLGLMARAMRDRS